MIKRWNAKTQEYDAYTPPSDWRVSAYEDDMGRHIDCASCGRDLPWGLTYTSRIVHTPMGFGYGVCGDCYEQERR